MGFFQVNKCSTSGRLAAEAVPGQLQAEKVWQRHGVRLNDGLDEATVRDPDLRNPAGLG